MQVAYEPWLVLLSIVMAVQGAYVGSTLAGQLGSATGVRRRVLLAGAAFSLAVAIWTMHFVGMLAARIPFSDRLSGFSNAPLASGLRACGRRRCICDQQWPLFFAAPLSVRLPDGCRHLHHAPTSAWPRCMRARIWNMRRFLSPRA